MINAHTQLYGVFGNPVRHSLSPIIHNGAFRRMGLNAAYVAFEVQNLAEAVSGIRGLGIRGVSVTIPFKTAVIPYLDHLEEVAGKIRAVNTISHEGGRLIGHNTDWLGAVGALEEKIDLRDKKVLLLGAGGAARALAFGLKERGGQVFVYNRTQARGRELAEDMGSVCLPWESIRKWEAQVIINATSVGMAPRETETLWPKELFRKGTVVMDIVYRPVQTRFLREAEEQGCRTIDGLEMLARQGAAQIEIWTGKKPDIPSIKRDLQKALK